MNTKLISCFLGLFIIMASCTTTKKTDIKDVVSTQSGLVSGTFDESTGITVFKGIPFAAPPVGDLRWKAPQPLGPWGGVKECNAFSASPIQATPVPFMMWTQEFIAPNEPLSEDCLYLNVWTGAKTPDENRPVFVYIYGGGFTSGSGAVPVYDGTEIAKKGLVFLTINYRVGTMGFLAHPELTAESPNHASGNYGLLDQVEALKWVQKNIQAFGGNPDNVTIAGQSALRLLRNIFRGGLFENPYLEVEKTEVTVGNADFMAAGFDAQLKSVVLLKNLENALPLKNNSSVYIPKKYYPASPGMFGFGGSEERWDYPVNLDIVGKYATVTEKPEDAAYALVFIDGPNGGSGYDPEDVKKGGNGYVPITLQYKPYKAEYAREVSLAGGDPLEDFTNRSYKNKTVTASNTKDLDLVLETKKTMGDKPVIVVVNVSNPMVFAEFKKAADAIVVSFGIQDQAILEVLSGKVEPSGLLPFQMPANMRTVEEQLEDIPRDMECYTDAAGNTYDFAFGLNWSGVINNARVQQYK